MNDSELVTLVVKIIFAVVSVAITTFVIPFLNELVLKYKNTRVESFVKESVQAAEQVIKGDKKGKEKKEKVIELVSNYLKKYSIDISSEEISNLIESAVFAMNKEIVE